MHDGYRWSGSCRESTRVLPPEQVLSPLVLRELAQKDHLRAALTKGARRGRGTPPNSRSRAGSCRRARTRSPRLVVAKAGGSDTFVMPPFGVSLARYNDLPCAPGPESTPVASPLDGTRGGALVPYGTRAPKELLHHLPALVLRRPSVSADPA
ncbi:hypothetical protein GCM10010446_30130 [Streptomyces enissocaesilis]|uniref:Uncharacterized protein n=1 Tax=Streptomyces enissocaesilis TaxID=332589 RepID=A0ABN3XA68_9ACTN